MLESLFNPAWYRVAKLRPRLGSQVGLTRHFYRGQRWYVLHHAATSRVQRLSWSAYRIVGLMDGQRTVQTLWDMANAALGDDAPTQDEIILLLSQLHAADLIQCDVLPDSDEVFARDRQREQAKRQGRFASPLFLRFPLIDPDRFLERWQHLARPFFSRTGLYTGMAVLAMTLILAATHWRELTAGGLEALLTPKNLLLLWLTYPVMKCLHELGHAFAVKRWGGEVHEMGIMVVALMPIPYVDASAASVFSDKRKRIAVSAAGIAVELLLASLAFFVWLNTEPGTVRTLALMVMMTGGISTLVFNGNPLLRFDGYYMLADAIEIPNLATRAKHYLGYLVNRHLLGLDSRPPVTTHGERAWFVVYGIAACIYRIALLLILLLYVASKYFVVGVLLALWAGVTHLAVPLVKLIRFLLFSAVTRPRRWRVIAICAGFSLLAGAALFAVPVPLWTHTEGVVWLPEQSHVRVGTDCFIARLSAGAGQRMHAGDVLVECEDPFLRTELKAQQAQRRELAARHDAYALSERVKREVLKEEIATLEADLARIRERIEKLRVRSPIDGTFIVPREEDLPGRFLKQGELVGYVIDGRGIRGRVVIPQSAIGLVRDRTQAVRVRLANRIDDLLPARVERQVPGATDQLPSPALGTLGGGPIAVDPADDTGVRALEKFFQFELALPETTFVEHFGARLYARFEHGNEPLAHRWYRSARRLFLSYFNA